MSVLNEISRFTFGTMSLGGADLASMANDVKVARSAMDAGVWFHTSREYAGGDTFAVLRRAFTEDRQHVPHCIFKCRRNNADILEYDIESALTRLNLERLSVVQLCGSMQSFYRNPSTLIHDCLHEGPMWNLIQRYRSSGQVQAFALEIFSSTSESVIPLIKRDLFDAYIFYYNVFEREVSDAALQTIQATGKAILALRTLGAAPRGQLPEQLQRPEAFGAEFSLLIRDRMLRGIRDRAGFPTWLDLSLAFLFAHPQVVTSIGGTRQLDHLERYLEAEKRCKPLATSLRDEIDELHRVWFGSPVQFTEQ